MHHGFLRLPHSTDESAWGAIMIPITVIQNGRGPTALLTGGNHGDEYEGPVALQDLAVTLRPERLAGRVIIVPAVNYPAFRAGTRTSPVDGVNLNRAFPGASDGSVTQKIADYVYRSLLPEADVVLDFHSGGKTLDFVPFAAAHIQHDKVNEAACFAAMTAFNAPFSVQLLELDPKGMFDTAAEDMGKTFVSTELGGGGSATARSIAIAKKGVRNLLVHADILDDALATDRSQHLAMPGDDCYVICENDGLFEPMVDLEFPVREGQPIARIWPLDRTGQAPLEYVAKRDGLVIGRHFPGRIYMGDCMMVVATPSENPPSAPSEPKR